MAVANARAEGADLAEALGHDHPGARLEPWDWQFYAEQVKKERRSLDDAILRPYLELERVLADGVFRAATELYGLTFAERHDLVGYHPDVRVFEVFDADGSELGLFLGDFWTRESKRGGAWMNNLVDQSTLLDERPVVVNNLNIPKPPDGRAHAARRGTRSSRCSTSSATRCTACSPRCGGRRSPAPRCRATSSSTRRRSTRCGPGTRRSCARSRVHHETGEPMPSEWVDTLLAARQDGEGFATTEYLAAALLDQAWYRLSPDEVPTDVDEVEAFEAAALRARRRRLRPGAAALPHHVLQPHLRRRLLGRLLLVHLVRGPRRRHGRVVPGERRAATGANGDTFRARLLSRGGSLDPMQAFRDLRGRDPLIDPLLARRGLPGRPPR